MYNPVHTYLFCMDTCGTKSASNYTAQTWLKASNRTHKCLWTT